MQKINAEIPAHKSCCLWKKLYNLDLVCSGPLQPKITLKNLRVVCILSYNLVNKAHPTFEVKFPTLVTG